MKTPRSSSLFRRESSFSLSRFALSVFMLAPLVVLPRGYALPTGAQVAAGQVNVVQSGATMTLTQASKNAIVNWQSFNLGTGESLRLAQSGADAALLARVTGSDPSQLLGALKADGKLFLINAKGIVVGQGAVIDTAAFVASTLDVADADFLRGGAMTFKSDSTAGIVNLGQITAREGSVMLFAHTVKNAGTISAPKGAASLAAGTEVYLGSPGDTSVVIKLNLAKTAERTGVENTGVIAAAQAELKAAGGSIYDLAVNQSGLVRATGFETKNGRIVLTAEGGAVNASGSAIARNADGSGGEILVGGSGSSRAGGTTPALPAATTTTVAASATLDAGNGGRAVVWSDDTTTFLGRIVTGGDRAGFAEVSGQRLLDFRPLTPLDLGQGGNLLLDPDAMFIGTADPGGGVSFVNVATLAAQLASSNITLDTSTAGGDITLGGALAWSSGNTLRLNSGGGINLNASLTAAAGGLALYSGKTSFGDPQHGVNPINGRIQQDATTTLNVGTLTLGQNTGANVAGATPDVPVKSGSVFLDGTVTAGTLQLDLSGNMGSVFATTAANSIGTLRTINSGGTVLGDLSVTDGSGGLNVMLAMPNSTATSVRIVTPGALTLQSGTNLTFAAQADVILASTGGAFNNNASAGAIGTNGRFLIYSNSSGATTKGGLVGTDVFSHPYNSGDSFADRTSRFLFSGASGGTPTLTYRADDKSRVYGDANPAFTFGVTGFLSGVTNDVTGTPLLSASATQSSGVGSYTITIGQGSLASNNYAFSFASGSLSITPASLIITPNNVARLYGDANPTLSASFTGLKNGDTGSAVTGLSLTTSATPTSSVGSYAINAAGATAANYTISYGSAGALSINPAPLAVTAPNATKTYGDTNPNLFVGFTTSGLRNGDSIDQAVVGLNFSTTATTASPVGTYPVNGSGSSSNYRVTFIPGSLTISKALLTIAAADASRVYGDANPAFSANITGLRNGDTAPSIAGLTFSTSATATSNVGDYAITPGGASLANSNYDITYQPGTLAIAPAPLTGTIANASRTYGGTNPSFSATFTGFKNADTTASAISGLTLTTSATTSSGVGSYAINGSATVSSNYALTFVPGTLTINSATLTLTPIQTGTRTYGDATDPTFNFTASGFVNGDTLLGFNAAGIKYSTGTTSASSAGSYALTMSGGSMPNYTIAYQPGTFTIAKAPLTVAINDATRVYGAANPAFTASYSGLRNGDTAASVASGVSLSTQAITGTPVGTYSINGSGSAQNYALTFQPGALTITPATLTVTANAVTGLTFGDLYPTLGYSVTGWVAGDTPTTLSGVTFSGLPALANTVAAGTYSLAIANPGAASSNYQTVAGAPTTVVVARKALEIVGPSLQVPSGSLVPATVPVTTPPLVAGGPTFTVTSAIPSSVANQTIASGGTVDIPVNIVPDSATTRTQIDQNYAITTKPGILSTLANVTFVDAGQVTVVPVTINSTVSTTSLTLTDTSTKITVKYGYVNPKSPMSKQDFADLLSVNGDAIKSVAATFAKSDGFKQLSAADQKVIKDFISGELSVAALSKLLSSGTDATALMPVFAAYAAQLISSTSPLDLMQQKLVTQISTAVADQRNQIAAQATAKYNAWEADQKSRVAAGFTMTIMPDIVSDSKTGVLTAALAGLGAGAAVGGGTAGAIMGTASAIFPFAGVGAAAQTAVEAASFAAGPAAAIVGVVAFVTVVSIVMIDQSNKNEAAYKDVLARAAATQTYGVGLGFQLKPPQNDADRSEILTGFMQVFGKAF